MTATQTANGDAIMRHFTSVEKLKRHHSPVILNQGCWRGMHGIDLREFTIIFMCSNAAATTAKFCGVSLFFYAFKRRRCDCNLPNMFCMHPGRRIKSASLNLPNLIRYMKLPNDSSLHPAAKPLLPSLVILFIASVLGQWNQRIIRFLSSASALKPILHFSRLTT